MNKTELFLRAAAELVAMPDGISGKGMHELVLATPHLKKIRMNECDLVIKLARIAEVLADA